MEWQSAFWLWMIMEIFLTLHVHVSVSTYFLLKKLTNTKMQIGISSSWLWNQFSIFSDSYCIVIYPSYVRRHDLSGRFSLYNGASTQDSDESTGNRLITAESTTCLCMYLIKIRTDGFFETYTEKSDSHDWHVTFTWISWSIHDEISNATCIIFAWNFHMIFMQTTS